MWYPVKPAPGVHPSWPSCHRAGTRTSFRDDANLDLFSDLMLPGGAESLVEAREDLAGDG